MRLVVYAIIIMVFIGCNNASEKEYYQLKLNHERLMSEFKEKYLNSTSQEEKMELMKQLPDSEAYMTKIIEMAEANSNRDFVADAWCQVFEMTWFKKNDSFKKAVNKLSNEYVKHEYLANISVPALVKSKGSNTEEFIKKVLKENQNEKVKGVFTLALAQKYTLYKKSKLYDLEKGLELFQQVKDKYANVEIKHGDDEKLTKLGYIAGNAIFNLTSMAIGKKMLGTTCKNLDGKVESLSDYSGNVIVLDVWATWCGPCVAMIPHQRKLVERLKNKPFKLISISLDSEVSKLEKFQQKVSMPWINWFNGPKGGIVDKWNILQSPTIIILDKNGIIRHRSNGVMSDNELDKIVDELVNEDV